MSAAGAKFQVHKQHAYNSLEQKKEDFNWTTPNRHISSLQCSAVWLYGVDSSRSVRLRSTFIYLFILCACFYFAICCNMRFASYRIVSLSLSWYIRRRLLHQILSKAIGLRVICAVVVVCGAIFHYGSRNFIAYFLLFCLGVRKNWKSISYFAGYSVAFVVGWLIHRRIVSNEFRILSHSTRALFIAYFFCVQYTKMWLFWRK